jgi:hypothetical protein
MFLSVIFFVNDFFRLLIFLPDISHVLELPGFK